MSIVTVPAISPTYIAASLTNKQKKIALKTSEATLRLILLIHGCSHVQIWMALGLQLLR
jgi:hypothetical protein